MIGGVTVLVLCQLLGELLAALLHLPIPGAVIGLILLFSGLLIRDLSRPPSKAADPGTRGPRDLPQGLETAAQGLLRHLALFFVPAGTGVIAYAALIREEWLSIAVTLLASTLLALAATGGVMQALQRRGSRG